MSVEPSRYHCSRQFLVKRNSGDRTGPAYPEMGQAAWQWWCKHPALELNRGDTPNWGEWQQFSVCNYFSPASDKFLQTSDRCYLTDRAAALDSTSNKSTGARTAMTMRLVQTNMNISRCTTVLSCMPELAENEKKDETSRPGLSKRKQAVALERNRRKK